MLFSSILFLWVFLPSVLVVNYLIGLLPIESKRKKTKIKNTFLLIASLVFYAWGGFYYLFLMLSVILINYFGGLLLKAAEERKRLVLIITIILNLALLFYLTFLFR